MLRNLVFYTVAASLMALVAQTTGASFSVILLALPLILLAVPIIDYIRIG